MCVVKYEWIIVRQFFNAYNWWKLNNSLIIKKNKQKEFS